MQKTPKSGDACLKGGILKTRKETSIKELTQMFSGFQIPQTIFAKIST